VIELQALERFPNPEWEQLVARLGGNPLHLPQIHLIERAERDLRFLVFREHDAEVACALALITTPRLHRLRGRARTLELPTAPTVATCPPATRQEVYRSLIEGCRTLDCRRLAIGHTWGDNLEDVAPLADCITDRVTDFVLDLSPPLDDILARMHKGHRKNTRRAEKLGLTIRAETTLSALEHLRQVQLTSSERSASRGHGFAIRDPAYYRTLHDRIYAPGIGEVLLAWRGDACIGALACLHSGAKGITVRSGCTPEGYESYAMYLLQSELLKRAKERGILTLNIGGVPAAAESADHPQHGLYEFKQGFGGQPALRTAAVMNL
jgi:hypothetical protein